MESPFGSFKNKIRIYKNHVGVKIGQSQKNSRSRPCQYGLWAHPRRAGMSTEWMMSLLGGVVIGVAVSLMLYLNGRVTGISGILNGPWPRKKGTRCGEFFLCWDLWWVVLY